MITAPTPTRGTNSARRSPLTGTPSQKQSGAPRLAPARPRRQLPVVALGVLLVVGGALASAAAWVDLGNRQAVLAVTRPVAAGQAITAGDLSVVHMSVDAGVVPVSAANEANVIGHPAAVPLVPNSLLTQSQVGSSAALSANQAIVGVALKDGQFPPGLAPGAHVMVVQTPGAQFSAASSTSALGTPSAVVIAVQQPQATSAATTIVSLRVDSSVAPQIAAAAAAGQVALIEVATTP